MNFTVKKINKTCTVYDIQVAKNPTFCVGNVGMIVHNCYLNFLDDTAEGLVDNLSETNWLSMYGGGVGIHVGIRGSDEKSVGVMPHLKVYDASSLAYRQGTTRRGSYATYLDISHPDIIQFIEMRKPTGDQNMRTLNLNHAINITDDFMQIIERCMVDPTADDKWNLVQPNSGKVVDTVSAKELWMRILEMRMQTGEPYIWFNDTANDALPDYQKKQGLRINGSNLCLTGDTIIEIKENEDSPSLKITLEDFIQKFKFGYYTNPLVKSFDGEQFCWSVVSDADKTGETEELYEIESPTGKIIRCTGDHKIFTKNRGYVEAKNLKETDELLEV